MMALVIALSLAQAGSCGGEAKAAIAAAYSRAEAFDLVGAAEVFRAGATAGCTEAELPSLYLSGLLWAREAAKQGGSPESLEPVKKVVAALEARANELPATAEIVRVVLLAASAASQSERDEMWLLLAHALRLEALQHAARQPIAPVISAHETAGDLWLQVHRFEEARQAYAAAAERIGVTPRTTLGLARAAARLAQPADACAEYRRLIEWWGSRLAEPPEIVEARAFLAQAACQR